MSLVQLRPEAPFAGVAHLVERDLAKVEVASSSLVARSKTPSCWMGFSFLKMHRSAGEPAASTCAERVKSRGEAGFLRMATAIRGMPGSEFEPRRPLQKRKTPKAAYWQDSKNKIFGIDCRSAQVTPPTLFSYRNLSKNAIFFSFSRHNLSNCAQWKGEGLFFRFLSYMMYTEITTGN